MSFFDDPEWGNSSAFSYYSGSSEFTVPSSVLDNSLHREQNNLNQDGKKLKRNKKRKLSEQRTGTSDDQDSPQKKKTLKGSKKEGKSFLLTASKSINTGEVPASPLRNAHNSEMVGQKNASDHTESAPKKQKKKKKIDKVKKSQNNAILKKSDSVNTKAVIAESNKIDTQKEDVSNKHPKKVKKKNKSKRNKYKELNMEQNKKKTNAMVNGTSETSLKHNENLAVASSNEDIRKTCNSVISSDKNIKTMGQGDVHIVENVSQPLLGTKEVMEKVALADIASGTSKVAKEKKKAKTIGPQQTLNSSTTNKSGADSMKNTSKPFKSKKKMDFESGKKVEKGSNVKINKKKTNTSVAHANNSAKEQKSETELGDNKKGSKKSKKKKRVKFEVKKMADSDEEIQEFDGEDEDEEEDSQLRDDLESYLKKLNIDKFKEGGPTKDISLSEEEWETEEEGSELEDDIEANKSKSPPEKIKTNKASDTAKHKSENGKELSGNNNQMLAGKKDKKKQQSEPSLPTTSKNESKFNKDILNKMLQEADSKNKPSAVSKAEALKQKMMNQLSAAKFRLVNEKMYTATSSDAVKMFKSEPASFSSYHSGFQAQVARWPMNPLDLMVKWLKNKPSQWVVADFGCGEAVLAKSIPQNQVHSFDLVAANSRVTACDMAHTPLQAKSVDVVVFCLSLMGTNIKDFILEANRVLREGGIMKIAEVESRFKDVNFFVSHVKKFGFHCTYSDTSSEYFFMFEFKKNRGIKDKTKLPTIVLKPCMYKKR